MGQRYKDLKQENEDLRQALAAKFVKHSIRPGDLICFMANQNPNPKHATRYQKSTIGLNFGQGYGCIENIRRMLCDLAGGPVAVMASSREEIDVFNLNRDERARLKATIEAIERGESKPTFTPLQNPLPPIYADPSVEGSVAWAVKMMGKTPCKNCGLPMEDGVHTRDCEAKQAEALKEVFK